MLGLTSVLTGCETVGDYCSTARYIYLTDSDKIAVKGMSRRAKEGIVQHDEDFKAKCL